MKQEKLAWISLEAAIRGFKILRSKYYIIHQHVISQHQSLEMFFQKIELN